MEKFYIAALSHFLGYAAAKKIDVLIGYYGSAQAVHQAGSKAVEYLHPTAALEQCYKSRYDKDLPQALTNYCQEHCLRVITRNDGEYPQLLKEIYDPPAALYVKGRALNASPQLAIVGSRKASAYGITVAQTFARTLATQGLTIVSGGAYGIDAAAHVGTLEAAGSTIVVLGGGFTNLYPAKHKKMFSDILAKGTLVTEYAPWEGARGIYFPLRNRIIVGLCTGVLIVEAAQKSGAMITANLALHENREVYVIPGNIFSTTSQGTNGLIKEGARLIDSPTEILADFILPSKGTAPLVQSSLFAQENSSNNLAKQGILKEIFAQPGITLEELVLKLDLTLSAVSCILLELQLAGQIVQEKHHTYRAI